MTTKNYPIFFFSLAWEHFFSVFSFFSSLSESLLFRDIYFSFLFSALRKVFKVRGIVFFFFQHLTLWPYLLFPGVRCIYYFMWSESWIRFDQSTLFSIYGNIAYSGPVSCDGLTSLGILQSYYAIKPINLLIVGSFFPPKV